mmetsp:Transcript_37494/g.42278  ORF Transcript_37494/g.42278 Transcript_37494/m.42278 type:complete len:241 (+) Transcript_37494:44-766(+)
MKSVMLYYVFFLVFGSIVANTIAFVPFDIKHQERQRQQHRKISVGTPSMDASPTPTKLQVLWDPRNEADHDSGLIEFPTSPQRIEIKKEAKKRKSRKQLPHFSLSEEEMDGQWSDETFQTVWKQLSVSEMMEIKGICRKDRRHVFQTAKLFCEELEDLISPSSGSNEENNKSGDEEEKDKGSSIPVSLITSKGHTALIYCPSLPVDHPDKFILRTSVGQKNVWTSRPKKLRDNRGQIIRE